MLREEELERKRRLAKQATAMLKRADAPTWLVLLAIAANIIPITVFDGFFLDDYTNIDNARNASWTLESLSTHCFHGSRASSDGYLFPGSELRPTSYHFRPLVVALYKAEPTPPRQEASPSGQKLDKAVKTRVRKRQPRMQINPQPALVSGQWIQGPRRDEPVQWRRSSDR